MKKVAYLFVSMLALAACDIDDFRGGGGDGSDDPAPPAVENLVLDESSDGDISDDNSNPTALNLFEGDNRVIVEQTGDPRDIDYLAVTIAEGFQLSEFILDEYVADPDNLAFIGVVAGGTFPVDVANDGNPDTAQLLGGVVYGSNDEGSDLLASIGSLDGATGFQGALPAGTYTFWFNQTGPTSGGTFNFVVTEAPEPVTGTLYDESVDGDISGDNTQPTVIEVVAGDNRVIATQQLTPRDIDYFTFTVPEGHQVEQLLLEAYTGEPAFIGFVGGDTFPIDVENDGNPTGDDLLGGLVYSAANIDDDILPLMMNIGQGFDIPLAAGSYTIWLNQTGTPSTASFNIVIAEVGS